MVRYSTAACMTTALTAHVALISAPSLAERPSAAAVAELALVHGVLFVVRPTDHVCLSRFLRFAELRIAGYLLHKCFAQRLAVVFVVRR